MVMSKPSGTKQISVRAPPRHRCQHWSLSHPPMLSRCQRLFDLPLVLRTQFTWRSAPSTYIIRSQNTHDRPFHIQIQRRASLTSQRCHQNPSHPIIITTATQSKRKRIGTIKKRTTRFIARTMSSCCAYTRRPSSPSLVTTPILRFGSVHCPIQ